MKMQYKNNNIYDDAGGYSLYVCVKCTVLMMIHFSSFFCVFFFVAVPPDIMDYPTSTDMVVREGSNVTLRCSATGSPEPQILWRRENALPITLPNGVEGNFMM